MDINRGGQKTLIKFIDDTCLYIFDPVYSFTPYSFILFYSQKVCSVNQ